MISVTCPECKSSISMDTAPEIGQLVNCISCQAVLEVIWLYPISLDTQEQSVTPVRPNPGSAESP